MFKASISAHIEKEGRHYCFCFDPDAPLGELHDVLFQMHSTVISQMQNSLNQPEQKVENEQPQIS